MATFILRTDVNGHSWEIRLRADGSIEHRREVRTSWVAGWPVSLPPLKDNENPFDGVKLVPKPPDTPSPIGIAIISGTDR